MVRRQVRWLDWWRWELELSWHAEFRMEERDLTEIELRGMLEATRRYEPDVFEGRWVARCSHRGRQWEVIVEPEPERRRLVVVTVYPLEA